jgi:hypothetical protein
MSTAIGKETGHRLTSRHAPSKFEGDHLSKIIEQSIKSVKPKHGEQMREKIIDRISDDLVYKIVLLQHLLEAQKEKGLSPIVQEELAGEIEELKGEIEAADCICAKEAKRKLSDKHVMYECYGCQAKGHLSEVETIVEGQKFVIRDNVKKIIAAMKKSKSKSAKPTKSSKSRKTRKSRA